MSAAMPSVSRGVRPGEDAALRHVTERLRQQFPELDADIVARTVHGRYDQLGDAPVRDFIPVLVERAAREQLETAIPDGQR